MSNQKYVIFVFGSNLAGRHGAGAAADAVRLYGAEYGVGEGLTGASYALPTKDKNIQTLPLEEIDRHIATFVEFARKNPIYIFRLTPVGCGLANLNVTDIISILKRYDVPDNVVLTKSWLEHL
jgi:hypothetical protein